jgi:predicted RecB family nuclease
MAPLFATSLDLRVVKGTLAKPTIQDPGLAVLIERGRRHEQGYLEHLKGNGFAVASIDGVGVDATSVAQTLAAMKFGMPVIAQPALQSGQWGGRADVLLRVEKPSKLGDWSYEVADTKLAQETKGGTILQLSLYSDLLATAQGIPPEKMYVVTPETDYVPEAYRVADFAAYYRRARRRLEEVVASDADDTLYPDLNPHCEVCRWRLHRDGKRRADDHLSLVAGISKAQIGELNKRDVTSTAALATLPLPLHGSPSAAQRIPMRECASKPASRSMADIKAAQFTKPCR